MVDEPRESAERARPPLSAPPANHGRTTAAWVTVALVVAGAVVASVGVVAAQVWLFWVGIAVVVIGVAAGLVLRAVGLGQEAPSRGRFTAGPDTDASKEQA
jgi:hypothetical protein